MQACVAFYLVAPGPDTIETLTPGWLYLIYLVVANMANEEPEFHPRSGCRKTPHLCFRTENRSISFVAGCVLVGL